MYVWMNNSFEGFWPVGTAVVVVAETPDDAANLLKLALLERGLKSDVCAEQFTLLQTITPRAYVLRDGNY